MPFGIAIWHSYQTTIDQADDISEVMLHYYYDYVSQTYDQMFANFDFAEVYSMNSGGCSVAMGTCAAQILQSHRQSLLRLAW